MMNRMIRRAEMLAGAEQRRQVQRLASRMKAMMGADAVEIVDAKVVVRGRGLIKRWLIDPGLRFLSSGFK